MGKRESLKDLQTRLADRLQLARSSGVSLAWLAVTAGGANYLLPLRQSGEILPLARLQKVPRTQPWFSGVINIRGSLFGTVDLGLFLTHALGAEGGAPPEAYRAEDEHSSVVTLNPMLEVNCALQVSRLNGLRAVESFGSSVPPDDGMPGYFGSRFLDLEGERWQEIDLQTLSQSPQFLNISA